MSDPVVRDKPDGVRCPRCGLADSAVVDSRGRAGSGWVRRRRECLACRARWTTMEISVAELDGLLAAGDALKRVAEVPNDVLLAEITRRFGWYVKEGEKKLF